MDIIKKLMIKIETLVKELNNTNQISDKVIKENSDLKREIKGFLSNSQDKS